MQEHIERFQRFNQPPEEKEEQEQRELDLNAGECGVIAVGMRWGSLLCKPLQPNST